MAAPYRLPETLVPRIHHVFNAYMIFDLNVPTLIMALELAYYFALEPLGAVSHIHLTIVYATEMA